MIPIAISVTFNGKTTSVISYLPYIVAIKINYIEEATIKI